MAERFDGDRRQIRDYGTYLINLSTEFHNFKWKPDPYLIDLFLRRDLLQLYGNAIAYEETEGQKVRKFAKGVDDEILFYFKIDDEFPILIGERIIPKKPNFKIYMTRYGAEIAEKIVSDIRGERPLIFSEISEKPKKEISLDKWILELCKAVGEPIDFSYFVNSSCSIFEKNPTRKEKTKISKSIITLVKNNKLAFENGEYSYKES